MNRVDYIAADGSRTELHFSPFSPGWWLFAACTAVRHFIKPPQVLRDGTALARENGRFVFREPGAPGYPARRSEGAA